MAEGLAEHPIEASVMRETLHGLPTMVATSHLWLFSTWKVARAAEELNFSYLFIVIKLPTCGVGLMCWTVQTWLFRHQSVLSISCLCSWHVHLLPMSISTGGWTRVERGCKRRLGQVGGVDNIRKVSDSVGTVSFPALPPVLGQVT